MNKYVRKVLSVVMVAMILAVLLLPSFAVDGDYTGTINPSKTGWWDQLLYQWTKNWSNDKLLGGVVQEVSGFLCGSVCSDSPDALHHASSVSDSEMHNGPHGSFTYATCTYCHQRFEVYASDLQQSYDAQVAELPGQVYDSTGSLFWSPKLLGFAVDGFLGHVVCPHFTYKSMKNSTTHQTISFDCENNSFSARVSSSSYTELIYEKFFTQWKDTYPIDGYYTRQEKSFVTGYYLDKKGEKCLVNLKYLGSEKDYHVVGTVCTDGFSRSPSSDYYLTYCSFDFHPPVFKVTPLDSLIGEVNTTYNINSRPGVMLGMYGDVNGSAFSNNSLSIVDETNNIYTNPATGQTDTITGWSYNYEDRSYTLTLGGGTTTTVTYGDENVTIKEGDTTYNIYYLVEGSGEDPDPGPGPDVPTDCDHTWTETSRTDPTCTTPGKVISTCSKCSQSKTETLPATGHSWVVDRTVQTTYDEEGNLLQQGYTIYSCSVCGEQYKDMEGTGPPADDDPGDGGIIEFLDGLIKSLSKNLHGAVELILSFFQEIPAMFDGFLAFLTAMFPFLPPEIMTLLAFGIAAVVFIGIIKALRR